MAVVSELSYRRGASVASVALLATFVSAVMRRGSGAVVLTPVVMAGVRSG